MARKLRDSVVVITGASSGIGKASAKLFANKGAALVLGARREDQLQELVTECEQMGGRAIAVQVDVSDEDEVQNLARQAIENYGRIDVWVNNAAVSLFGRFEEAPPEAFRQVIETNLFGYVYGARAALPYMREQGSGVIINNSSVFGTMGAPYLSAYVTSKFAIRGFSESLRQELVDEKNIHVCTILPASIDTPIFQHAANYTGRAVKPMRPVYDADMVASRIVHLAQHPKQEVVIGNAGRAIRMQRRFMPFVSEKMMAKQVDMDHFKDEPAEPSPGNVFEPVEYGTDISGGWKSPDGASSKGRLALFGAAAAVPAYFAWRKFSGNGGDNQKQDSRGRRERKDNGSTLAKAGKAGKAGIAAAKPVGKTAARKVREKVAA